MIMKRKTQHDSESGYLYVCDCCHIMCSDDDQPIVMDLYAGFDMRRRLVVRIALHDYDEPSCDCSTSAVVDPYDSRAMARNNNVKHADLPAFISYCMSGWRDIVNPDFNDVRNCFKEITECLLDEGCRFHIVRTLGKNRHCCC